jgi:hypothetical protein
MEVDRQHGREEQADDAKVSLVGLQRNIRIRFDCDLLPVMERLIANPPR